MLPPGFRHTFSSYIINIHSDLYVKNASSQALKNCRHFCRQLLLVSIQSVLRISCTKFILVDTLYSDCFLISNILRKDSKNCKLKVIISIRIFSKMFFNINIPSVVSFVILRPSSKDTIIVIG